MTGDTDFVSIRLLVCFSRYSLKQDVLGTVMYQILLLHSMGTMRNKMNRWSLEFLYKTKPLQSGWKLEQVGFVLQQQWYSKHFAFT